MLHRAACTPLHTHTVPLLVSFSAHRTMAPSLSEIGRVVRLTSSIMGGGAVLVWFTTRAKSSLDVAMMITSTWYRDASDSPAALKMTCTKLSEMLYCAAMLRLSCCITDSGAEALLEFGAPMLIKPLRRSPSL